MKNFTKNRKGFTLIELIIVIAIIAILAAAIFVAIDPAQKLNSSRNEQRLSDITNILDRVVEYQVDNSGAHYTTIAALTPGEYSVIGTCTSGATCSTQATQSACINLTAIGSNYLATIPKDPKAETAADTDYYLMIDEKGAVTVGACEPEGEGAGGAGTAPTIEITK